MSNQDRYLYEFGPFRLDLTERLLWRDGQPVTIPPIAFDTLLVLVERHGHLVTKDQLLSLVWPDSFVEEGNLTNNISILRKALGEGADGHRYIETLPRRGYRFVAAVKELPDEVLVKERTRTRVVIEEEIDRLPEPTNRAEGTATLTARRQLKNRRTLQITTAVIIAAGFAIAVLYSLLANRPQQPVTSASIRSIAVLPFKPLVADRRDEALELGMADALITRLSSIREITIRPTSAVRKYMNLQQDALAAGRELSVESVLESSIQRSGDRIRVTSRLKRVVDGAQLWVFQCEEDKCTDLFAVQDSISARVAGALEFGVHPLSETKS